MKVLLDCNVLISAGLGSSQCRDVIRHAFKSHELIVSEPIVAEYLMVARRPKFDRRRRSFLRLVQLIGRSADLVVPVSSPFRATDPDDQIYLDAAFAAEVDIFVTGNIADFPARECGKTRIVTPREFLSDIRFK